MPSRFLNFGPAGLPPRVPAPAVSAWACDGNTSPEGICLGFGLTAMRAFLMHENFICFSHPCPSRGKELDKEGSVGSPRSQALARSLLPSRLGLARAKLLVCTLLCRWLSSRHPAGLI